MKKDGRNLALSIPIIVNVCHLTSSVRRILKRGGAKNFRKFERNIDQNLKLSHSNFVPFFAQNQVKSKKKGIHSNFVPFFAQNQVKS